ncbi:hypothetical protein F9B74_03860 [Pelistega sp. NLN82]|uniref:Uncharacterized protein n=1 Tax=Pelistega ratti TaxID=2652177 RepID=A0A6L9Y525_9BURK|nr:hypothetical protein [Pelistega ratti]NEN75463.1 hypothetical protein [Pelistega ratti]
MGKYISENIEKEILSINWFSQLGKPINIDNISIETNLNKVNEKINSPEWENITLEESNNINSYFLQKNLFSKQDEWDLIAEEGRDFIKNKVIPIIPEINGLTREIIINDISWNLIHFIIEDYYKRKKIIRTSFFSELFELYRLGRLPCGWDGDFPNGKLIIA